MLKGQGLQQRLFAHEVFGTTEHCDVTQLFFQCCL